MKLSVHFFCLFSLNLVQLSTSDDFQKYCSHVQLGLVGKCIQVDWLADQLVPNVDIDFDYFYNADDETCNMQFQCTGLQSCVLVGNFEENGDLIYDSDNQEKSTCQKTLQWFDEGWAIAGDPLKETSKDSVYECYVGQLESPKVLDIAPDCSSTTSYRTSVSTSPMMSSTTATIKSSTSTTTGITSEPSQKSTTTREPPRSSTTTREPSKSSTTTSKPSQKSTTTSEPSKSSKTTVRITTHKTTSFQPDDSTTPYTSTRRSHTAAPRQNNGTTIALAVSLGVTGILLIICVIVLISIYVLKQKKRERARREEEDDHVYHWRH